MAETNIIKVGEGRVEEGMDVLQLCSRAEARVIGILVRRREQTENEVVQ